jgi:hypothetical protein
MSLFFRLSIGLQAVSTLRARQSGVRRPARGTRRSDRANH